MKTGGKSSSAPEPSPEGVQTYIEILNVAIRMGVYFNIRQLILSSLENVLASHIPFLHSIVSNIIPRLNPAEAEDQDNLRKLSDFFGKPPLVCNNESRLAGMLASEDWLDSKSLKLMMSCLAAALPYASKIPSSLFVAEFESERRPAKNICVDSHFNNLNCVASTVAHFLTAAIEATASRSEDSLSQAEIHENFLSQVVANLNEYSRQASRATSKKEELSQLQNYESVLLLVTQMAEKSPSLNVAALAIHCPQSGIVMQRARGRCLSKKAAKSLTLDAKTINPSRAGALKANWNSTLKEAVN